MSGHVATAEVDISASPRQVWDALVDPAKIEKYFFGSKVESDWRPGSPITWRGEYDGRSYEDKGSIVEVWPGRRLHVTHYSPLTGVPDEPQNYHQIVYELQRSGESTHVTLTQDNNASAEEASHSAQNWMAMLQGLKELVERG